MEITRNIHKIKEELNKVKRKAVCAEKEDTGFFF